MAKRKLQYNGRYTITLPRRDVEILGWVRGDEIDFVLNAKKKEIKMKQK